MIRFANAKINIGLNITGRRTDGYHNIETLFYPIGWKDTIEIIESQSTITQLHSFGLKIDGEEEDNLVMRAFRLVAHSHKVKPMEIYLQKNIPMGAGLGGGSSDAATLLLMLNEEMQLGMSVNEMEEKAAQLGADCAFFLHNKPTLAYGIGNEFHNCTTDLKNYHIAVVKPDIHVNTASAYKSCAPRKWDIPLSEALQLPVCEWKHLVTNDFENPIFSQHPQLSHLKSMMYGLGAVYASMSGSGSSIYGLFSCETDKTTLQHEAKKILGNMNHQWFIDKMM